MSKMREFLPITLSLNPFYKALMAVIAPITAMDIYTRTYVRTLKETLP